MGKRELKFKAWDKVTAQFVTSFTMTPNGDVELWVAEGSQGTREPSDFVVVQYTGLKDKNGVEIYEGDIVAWETGHKPGVQDCKMTVEIRVGKLGVLQSIPAINATSEVIGNIYENPELLKEQL